MHEWAVKWQIDFDINLCNMFHVGKHNTGNRYILGGVDLGKSNSEEKLRSVGKLGPEIQKAVYQFQKQSEQGTGFHHHKTK